MDNVQFLAWLHDNNACDSAVKRAGAKSAQEVWDTWGNPSELLWWVEKSGLVSAQQLTLIACGIVRNTPLLSGGTVWDLLADERSRNAVEVAERWANGEATDEEKGTAARTAETAAAAAEWEAEWAAWAAAWALEAERALAVGRAARAAAAAVGRAARAAEAAARVWAGAEAAARVWQLAYIREQLPGFVERFTEAQKNTYGVL